METKTEVDGGACCKRDFSSWFKKFFLEGQKLHSGQAAKMESNLTHEDWHKRFMSRHRRAIGFLAPVCFIQLLYWSAFISHGRWYIYTEKYAMSITMVFGALIAGMTSEGGGAVAFPVMTLVLGVHPSVARDFSVMVQACGMTAASLSIILQRIHFEFYAMLLGSLGGVIGAIGGFYTVDRYFDPKQKKMGFVTIWFSFAFALFLLNRYNKRKTYYKIHNMRLWKATVLLVAGIVGGLFTSFAGNGLDVCCFSVLTLLFRVSEKVATPTSVMLMAFNSCVCFYWRGLVMGEISQDAFDYLGVTVPIVTIMAPVGATLGSHFHRHVLASFVYILDTVALVTAFIILPLGTTLIIVSVAIIVAGFVFFGFLTYMGSRTIAEYERLEIVDAYGEREAVCIPTVSNGCDNLGAQF
ncbi:hypothetical protein LSAT2_016771 [Lamellibrachia satsuma]|nr:hypothetical protein LSAT2_016771 [Lamellibrachia satsuma]